MTRIRRFGYAIGLFAIVIPLSVTAAETPAATDHVAAHLDRAADTYWKAVKKCGYRPHEMRDACEQAAAADYRGAAGYAIDEMSKVYNN